MQNILLADDEKIVHQTLGKYLRASGKQFFGAHDGLSALDLIKSNTFDMALVDVQMPKMDGLTLLSQIRTIRPYLPVVMITGHEDMNVVIQALRYGATDFIRKPIKLAELDAVIEKAVLNFKQKNKQLKITSKTDGKIIDDDYITPDFVGKSSASLKVWDQIKQLSQANCDTILITGETGTGKEIVAREIYKQTKSNNAPFIAVNCPSIPDSLVESELFGHKKGAFTGATNDRIGCFELANNGTLFLDEIADLSPSAQASLLRVLENRTIRRIGGNKEINVNVQVVAATNKSIEELIEADKFRLDLYYRLNLFMIYLSPLRERREDIMPLAEHFLRTHASARERQYYGFSPEAKNFLLNYNFPGNVRELRNMVERSTILSRSGQVQIEHLHIPKKIVKSRFDIKSPFN